MMKAYVRVVQRGGVQVLAGDIVYFKEFNGKTKLLDDVFGIYDFV